MYTQEEIDRLKDEFTDTLAGTLGIRLLPTEGDSVRACMPVDRRTCRPQGVLNGGASIALAETLAGYASRAVCNAGLAVMGMQVSANHISPAFAGDTVTATARALHLGRSTHIWDIEVRSNGSGKLVSSIRVVNFIGVTQQ